MSNELKPCPFCGHPESFWCNEWQIECGACFATAPLRENVEEAIAAWDTRATDGEVEALKAQLAALASACAAVTPEAAAQIEPERVRRYLEATGWVYYRHCAGEDYYRCQFVGGIWRHLVQVPQSKSRRMAEVIELIAHAENCLTNEGLVRPGEVLLRLWEGESK